MKIIITEGKLIKVATQFLDDNYGDLEKEYQPRLDAMFYKQNGDYIFEYSFSYNFLYVDKEVWNSLSGYFGLEEHQINSLINSWFEKRYKYECKLDVRPTSPERWDILKQQRQYANNNNGE